jgi:hypothetical protein
MLLDSLLAFSTDQLLTETANSENFPLDLEVVNPNLGAGAEVGVMFVVKVTLASGTSVRVDVMHGASSANAVLVSSVAIAAATLVKGYSLFIPLPKNVSRYLGVTYTIVGTFDAGAVDCYLTTKQ